MTGRSLQPGRRWLAGFLAIAAMVGWSVGVPDSAAGKDACPPERADDTSVPVGNTTAFGSGTLAYNMQRPDDSSAGIWVMDADGTNPLRVADTGSRPVWSPDGNRIAYEEWTSGEVWVMDGGRRTQAAADRYRFPPGVVARREPHRLRGAGQRWGLGDGRGRRQPVAADRGLGTGVVAGREPHHLQRRRGLDDGLGRRQRPAARRWRSGCRMVAGRAPDRLLRVGSG